MATMVSLDFQSVSKLVCPHHHATVPSSFPFILGGPVTEKATSHAFFHPLSFWDNR